MHRLAASISSFMGALRSAPLPYNSTVDHALSRVQTGQGRQTSDDDGAGIHRSCGISEQAVVKHGKVVKGEESPARQTSESADSAAEKLDLVAVWPTDEQINRALVRVQYQEDCLHFAVSGQSCSGKSSLINALRSIKNKDPNAAKSATPKIRLPLLGIRGANGSRGLLGTMSLVRELERSRLPNILINKACSFSTLLSWYMTVYVLKCILRMFYKSS
jgi:hypothetical protein